MNATETAQKRADKLLAEVRKQYGSIQDEIEKYKIQQANASEAMAKAGDVCDLDKYNKAKGDKDKAEGALEMFQAKAERLESEPLIDQGEYEKLCGDIENEFNDYIESLRADLYDITRQLIEKYEEAHAKLRAANEALHTLQFDVYRGYDLEYLGNTNNINDRSKKTVGTREQFDVLQWANSISKTEYDKMKQERGADQ